jgi:hypothetical protein
MADSVEPPRERRHCGMIAASGLGVPSDEVATPTWGIRSMRLHATVAATITAAVAALLTLGVAPPAAAAAPVVVSPANGASLPSGSTGPLVIDFPATTGNYLVSVKCGASEYYWWTGAFKPYSGRQSIAIDPLEGHGGRDLGGSTCQVEVSGGNPYAKTISTFSLASPPLTLTDVSATKAEFYPLVRDGYLDETEFVFSVNRKTDATLTVTDTDGKSVYSRSTWLDRAGEYRLPWRGQTTSGKRAKPGKYQATLTAVADGTTLSQSTTVRVVTKKVIRRETLRRDNFGGREATGGNCRVEYEDEGTLLDCWGGAYARSTYTFKIPADATSIRWGAPLTFTGLDQGHGRGTLTRTGTRISKTTFQVRVQVTGWRATYARGASVSYRARVQI